MSYTERFTEVHDVLAALAPTAANGTVGTHNSAWASVADYHRVFALLHLGEAAQGATIDLALQQATVAAGTDAKAITVDNAGAVNKAITQVTATDDGYVGIELRTAELDVPNGFDYVRAVVTVGTGTFTYSLYLFGLESRYEPVGVTDWQEIIA